MVPCACNLIIRWQRWADLRNSLPSQPICNRWTSCSGIDPVSREWSRQQLMPSAGFHIMCRGVLYRSRNNSHTAVSPEPHCSVSDSLWSLDPLQLPAELAVSRTDATDQRVSPSGSLGSTLWPVRRKGLCIVGKFQVFPKISELCLPES